MTAPLSARITHGHLLDGRIIHAQTAGGHRTGIEPVLLAASVPARSGESVIEAGCGSGAGLLCLAARIADLRGVGIEIAPEVADIARANVAANNFAGLHILTGDVASLHGPTRHDHAFANPPWHRQDSTPSPDPGRALAKRSNAATFAVWASALARTLRHRGTLTFIVAAGALPECIDAFRAAGCGSLTVYPLWPRAGEAAKLLMLRGRKGGRATTTVQPGLVLHDADGSFTPASTRVLRGGSYLPLC